MERSLASHSSLKLLLLRTINTNVVEINTKTQCLAHELIMQKSKMEWHTYPVIDERISTNSEAVASHIVIGTA